MVDYLEENEEDIRECEPTDGLYNKRAIECLGCNNTCAELCKMFSILNGMKEYDYYNELPENFKKKYGE
ncbi:MAG: hypothetical protein CL489_16530 [Acidobacteria bacterium]|nr:hypothetical protein [Acidobacteriota bacterium]|tara:strand:+ start:17655 stop:17861 length:207 start_codon:yes stop_codon:yes gene_type:complete